MRPPADADLAKGGLAPSRLAILPGVGRKAVITDPEGNTITFAELGGSRT
jgi:predicted enzyme related to lactoylglutathione lyase